MCTLYLKYNKLIIKICCDWAVDFFVMSKAPIDNSTIFWYNLEIERQNALNQLQTRKDGIP